MAEVKLKAVIEAEDRTAGAIKSAQTNINGLQDKVKAMQPAFKTMAVAGGIAFTAISALAISSFKAYADAQAQTVITNQSLKNSLDGLSKDALVKLQKELGGTKDLLGGLKTSAEEAGKQALKMGFDDEEASRSFAKLFGITKSKTQAMKELATAEDLARFKNISLEEATQKLVLVHAGATKELKALGLEVNKDASAMENIDSITKQVSGSTAEFAKTAEGAMQIMKVNSDNLKESIGGALAPAFAKVKDILIPLVQKFVDWAEKNPELLAKIILIGGAVAGLALALGTLGMILPAIITAFTILAGPIGLVVAIVVALGFAVMQVVKIFQLLQTDGDLVWAGIKITINESIEWIKKILQKGLDAIKKIWDGMWKGIGDFFTGIWDAITNTARVAIEKIKSYLQPIIDMVEKTINKLNQIGAGIKSGASKVGDFLIDKVGGTINKTLGINDGIVQNGQIITTHPDDFLIATKNPGSLGGGRNINININGAVLTKEVASVVGDMIVDQLRFQLKF